MLKLLLVGLGIALVAGGAYAVYYCNKNKRTGRTSDIELKQQKELNFEKEVKSERESVSEREPMPQTEEKSPAGSETKNQSLDEIKDKCWEKFKELREAEHIAKCYAKGFGEHGILYYTQRLLGAVYIEKDDSAETFVYLAKKIGNALNSMVYKLEQSKNNISSTKDGFFLSNFAQLTRESVESKIYELEEIINKTVNSKNYVFYKALYNNTLEIYDKLINLAKSEDISPKEILAIVDEMKKALENNNVLVRFVEDVDLSKEQSEFICNPDSSQMPAILRKDDGLVILQGSYCSGGDRVE